MIKTLRSGDWIKPDPDADLVRVVRQIVDHPAGPVVVFAGGDYISLDQLDAAGAVIVPRPLKQPNEVISITEQRKKREAAA